MRKKIRAVALATDMEKAFDSIEIPYLTAVLKHMDCDPYFLSIIKAIYADPRVNLYINCVQGK